ncbi:MAG: hypothetical protein P4L55_11800 [Syntrophobacteraceae bacterium]|nr:hypothetical protein [Syntrophobacteraceae bacterium]
MSSNLFRYKAEGCCDCGFRLPIVGRIHDTRFEVKGYIGGYRSVAALHMIRSILFLPGVTERAQIEAVMVKVLREGFIRELYNRLNRIESYLETVDHFAALTDQGIRAAAFRRYVESRVKQIRRKSRGIGETGRLLFAGTPPHRHV